MYCSTCGVSVAEGLSYCKSCGAKLTQDNPAGNSSIVKPELLLRLMVVTFIFGLGIIAVLMGVMKVILGLPAEQVLGFMLFPFLLMLILEGVFMRLLLRGKSATERRTPALTKQQATNELDTAQGLALPEGMPSVTEHTTRAFEPIYKRPGQEER
ncbi:MAG TPA: hypothetical protein VF088_19120 [Pyrinomonadaceae bacterium]